MGNDGDNGDDGDDVDDGDDGDNGDGMRDDTGYDILNEGEMLRQVIR